MISANLLPPPMNAEERRWNRGFYRRLSALICGLLIAGPAFPQPPQVNLQNSQRVQDLMRAGNLYLSLQDALALAIENNLDIELERYQFPVAGAELLRAKGGGTVRGLNYTLAEAPLGVGGPLSPLVTNAASAGSAVSGASVATNASELGVLGEPQDNLSVQGTVPQSNGTPVPVFEPSLIGQLTWTHLGAAAQLLRLRHAESGDQRSHRQCRREPGLRQ